MKVIIPVAGAGNRLRPHTLSLPKPLLQVADRPILGHILEPLLALDPNEVIFVIGSNGEQIVEYVRGSYSFKSTFVSQDNLLGLGYAIHLALKNMQDDELVIVLGDTIVECDFGRLVKTGDNVLAVCEVDDPGRFGIVEIKDNRIIGVEEKPDKPKSSLAISGLYYFHDPSPLRQHLNDLVDSGRKTSGEIQLTDALESMIRCDIPFAPFQIDRWYDCGKKETLLESNRHLLERLESPKPIDGSTVIAPSYIGNEVQIERSIIGPFAAIADEAKISGSVIRNTIVNKGASVRNIIVEDSIIGRQAKVHGQRRQLNLGDFSEIETD